MIKAKYSEQLSGNRVKCTLCPHNCVIKEGKKGICQVRENKGGELMTSVYGKYAAYNMDPIEKKPLYHFYPGRNVVSIGSIGCNFHCLFCQNWELARCSNGAAMAMRSMTPKDVVKQAESYHDNIGIAFTYNEPIVWYEYMFDIAQLAKANNQYTVMVTNGFINPEPLDAILPYIDAFSLDFKAFNDKFYKKYTKSQLAPVLESLKQIYNAGKHVEMTNLVIPTLNDDENEFRDMLHWITKNLDEDVPLHISRYYPSYKMQIKPTPPVTLKKFYEIAREYLHYVYLGNIAIEGTANTYCKNCGTVLINRNFFMADKQGLDSNGKCKNCGTKNFEYI